MGLVGLWSDWGVAACWLGVGLTRLDLPYSTVYHLLTAYPSSLLSGPLCIACGLLGLSVAFVNCMNFDNLLIPSSVPTNLSSWPFLPVPSIEHWLMNLGQFLIMWCLV